MTRSPVAVAFGAAAALAISHGAASAQGEVNVYTYRESKLIQPLFEAFTKDTGIKVNVDLGELRPRAAHQDRRRQQPGRRAAHGRHRPPRGRGAGRHHAADQVGDARQGGGAAIPRPGGPLVRRLDARARDLCLEGAREAGRDHLRGARRSEVEGQDLHPLRPAHLQQRAVRRLHRAPRRGRRPRSGSRA